jgi:hypothetical protein
MSLKELIDNSRTDKNTTHSYLDLYQKLLSKKKHLATNVLEVGICKGGSIKLWRDFFVNANIYGIDLMTEIEDNLWSDIINDKKIKMLLGQNGYDENFVNSEFMNKDIKFDFILDDGPHTLETMKKFIKLYSPLIKDDGILMIEDVQSINWIQPLINEVPEHLKKYIKAYDLRPNKNRYDDIVFTIDKSD